MTKEEFNSIIERYLAGTATPSEKRLIDNFFNSQERNYPAVNEHIRYDMWSSIEAQVRRPAWPVRVARKIRLIHVVTPLVVLILVFCAAFLYYRIVPNGQEEEWITEEAPHGQKSIITLTDGSKVFLNSGSKISFPKKFLPTSPREITLTGQAFFEVVKNPSRPFIVHSGNVTTKVLGTSFDVNAFEGRDISVTVATGKVQVEATIDGEPSRTSVRQVMLTPMQQAVLKGEEWTTSEVDLSTALAWRTNTIRFDDTTVADVATELERWYNVSISFEDDGIRNCKVNGQFKDQSLADVLKSIHYMYNVDFKFTNQNQIILYGNGCKN